MKNLFVILFLPLFAAGSYAQQHVSGDSLQKERVYVENSFIIGVHSYPAIGAGDQLLIGKGRLMAGCRATLFGVLGNKSSNHGRFYQLAAPIGFRLFSRKATHFRFFAGPSFTRYSYTNYDYSWTYQEGYYKKNVRDVFGVLAMAELSFLNKKQKPAFGMALFSVLDDETVVLGLQAAFKFGTKQ